MKPYRYHKPRLTSVEGEQGDLRQAYAIACGRSKRMSICLPKTLLSCLKPTSLRLR
ncbi:hypothetical protein D3C80_1900590 [compost metagenome]